MDDLEKVIASDPKVQAISADARLFSELVDHPGWQRLRKRAIAVRDNDVENLAKRLLRGEEIPQRELDFRRGWNQCLEWLTGTPERSMETFEQAVERAYRLAVVEQLVGDDENPPYN